MKKIGKDLSREEFTFISLTVTGAVLGLIGGLFFFFEWLLIIPVGILSGCAFEKMGNKLKWLLTLDLGILIGGIIPFILWSKSIDPYTTLPRWLEYVVFTLAVPTLFTLSGYVGYVLHYVKRRSQINLL
jgi:hypothetical protein